MAMGLTTISNGQTAVFDDWRDGLTVDLLTILTCEEKRHGIDGEGSAVVGRVSEG
jgi:hypothetical protein